MLLLLLLRHGRRRKAARRRLRRRIDVRRRKPTVLALTGAPPPGTVLVRFRMDRHSGLKGELRLPRIALEGVFRHERDERCGLGRWLLHDFSSLASRVRTLVATYFSRATRVLCLLSSQCSAVTLPRLLVKHFNGCRIKIKRALSLPLLKRGNPPILASSAWQSSGTMGFRRRRPSS